MDQILSEDFVNRVAHEHADYYNIDATTLALIFQLLTPIDQQLSYIHTHDEIDNLPQSIIDGAAEHAPQNYNFVADIPIHEYKILILNEIIYQLISDATNRIPVDDKVMPWDIQRVIIDNDWGNFFHIPINDLLPVTIRTFTHEISFEMAMGLILWGEELSMYGLPLTYFDKHHRFQSGTIGDGDHYRIIIRGNEYEFESPEFIRGFMTGALWSNVDVHSYAHSLRFFNREHPDGIDLNFN